MFQQFTLSMVSNLSLLCKVCRVLAIVFGLYILSKQIFFPVSTYAQDTSGSDFVLKWNASNNAITRDIAWGDMDGDGDLDLALGNGGNNKVNIVYKNEGMGIFTKIEIDDPNDKYWDTYSIAWGDIDSDGDLDLVAGNYSTYNQVYQNDGNNHFTVFDLPGDPPNTISIDLGDMDGDGDLDLAAGNGDRFGEQGDRANLIYRNEGGECFIMPQKDLEECFTLIPLELEYAARNTMSIAWGDIDNDGDLDLVAGNGSELKGGADFNTLYRNDGKGGFTAQDIGGVERSSMSVVWGDMDKDGDLDLAVINGGGELEASQIYRNEGDGFFTIIELPNSLNNGRDASWGDIDIDGDLDLMIVSSPNILASFRSRYQIYRNDDGTFTPLSVVIFDYKQQIASGALGDMDNDGDLDLAIGNHGFNQIYENTQTFSLQKPKQLDAFAYIWSTAWGDMDNDGDLDLATGGGGFSNNPENKANNIYRNNGFGSFSKLPIDQKGNDLNTRSIAWGDLNNDGYLDIVVGNGENLADGGKGKANIIYHNENGEKFITITLDANTNAMLNTFSIALGDMDNDGDIDIAAGNGGSTITRTNILYRNDDHWNFSPLPLESFLNARDTRSVAWGDMDNDGDLDLAVGNTGPIGGGINQIYRNDGDGIFNVFDLTNEVRDTNDIAWGDMDNDGDLDLAVGNNGFNEVYRNDGDENFVPITLDPTRMETQGIAWGDINNDGYLDIVAKTAQLNYKVDNQIYINNQDGYFTSQPLKVEASGYGDAAWGDIDNDADLDLIIAGSDIMIYTNTLYGGRLLLNNPPIIKAYAPYTTAVAGFYAVPTVLASSQITVNYTLSDPESDPVGRVEAFYSLNGGGHWLPAVSTSETVTTNLMTAIITQVTSALTIPDNDAVTTTLEFSGTGSIEELEVTLEISHPVSSQLSAALVSPWPAPTGTHILLFSGVGGDRPGFNRLILSDRSTKSIEDVSSIRKSPINGKYRPAMPLSVLHGEPLNTPLTLIFTDTVTGQTGKVEKIVLRSIGRQHTYVWDTLASGFFGQSDNVVMRFVAYNQPLATTQVAPGTFLYPNSAVGSYQRASVASATLPFRVRGTQVQVVDEKGQPVPDSLVYRLAQTDATGNLMTIGEAPSHTNWQGYLPGRGTLSVGDQLLALAPQPLPITTTMQWAAGLTDTIHLYYTSGIVTETGVTTWISNTESVTVTESGVQVLQVSSKNPLLLFDLRVALEWDASTDPNEIYLSQLRADLRKAAEFLYDFTNGQATLGTITVTQNAEDWMYSDVVVKATNRLRPLAVQGGIVYTATQDIDSDPIITYTPGQVIMGSTWNRYGTAGQNLGYDWPLALAHELSHYLFFLDDTYLGKNQQGLLIPVDSCQGSVMGDMYNPSGANTEFIRDKNYWDKQCQNTLAHELGRTEWGMILQRYPVLSDTNVLTGPSQMPFQFTQITITTPLTPTPTLADPIFFLDYPPSNQVSSTSSRAYLIRDGQYLFELGTAIGGQNRLLARGAQVGDTLCVFDQQANAAGCEEVKSNDERLMLRRLFNWQPQIAIHPVTTTTLNIQVEFPDTSPYTPTGQLAVRIFPTLNKVTQAIPLEWNGRIYSATAPAVITYTLAYTLDTVERSEVFTLPIASGHLELWEDTDPTDGLTTPKMDANRAMVAFAIGGNFGNDPKLWAIGPHIRASGPHIRASGPHIRASGTFQRSSNAPVASTDGQLIFFIEDASDLAVGDLYSLQSAAGFPLLPNNTEAVGSVYRLITAGSNEMITGSVSFQYLGSDALALGITEADEQALMIYHCCDQQGEWDQLPTVISTTYNLASTAITSSNGAGFYALLARVNRPHIEEPKSIVAQSAKTSIVIQGANFAANTQLLLIDCHGVSRILQPDDVTDTTITVTPLEYPSGTYTVFIIKDNRISQESDVLTIEGSSPNGLSNNCPSPNQ